MSVREQVNFKRYEYEDVKMALTHSLYSVVVFEEEQPIGIGRVVGDGRIAFFIKDIVVIPEYQNKKIGVMIMQQIENYISETACEGAYIGLMSTPGQEPFYKKFGFIERPNNGFGAGMIKYHGTKKV